MSEWISVEDRLPPQDGTKFIVFKPRKMRPDGRDDYTFMSVVFYRWDDAIDPEYLGDPDDAEEDDCILTPKLLTAWSHTDIGMSFTHWMPLPEPPEAA